MYFFKGPLCLFYSGNVICGCEMRFRTEGNFFFFTGVFDENEIAEVADGNTAVF